MFKIVPQKNEHIILFDGLCNLCDRSIQFVIRKDKQKKIKFASLQSDTAHTLLSDLGFQNNTINSVILISNNKCYTQSTAALMVLKLLGGFWAMFYVLIVVPKFLRDSIYSFVARNRYRWFGKKTECMLPTENIKERFLN